MNLPIYPQGHSNMRQNHPVFSFCTTTTKISMTGNSLPEGNEIFVYRSTFQKTTLLCREFQGLKHDPGGAGPLACPAHLCTSVLKNLSCQPGCWTSEETHLPSAVIYFLPPLLDAAFPPMAASSSVHSPQAQPKGLSPLQRTTDEHYDRHGSIRPCGAG